MEEYMFTNISYFRIGQKIKARKRAPNHSTEDEKRNFKEGLVELTTKFGKGPFYVSLALETPAHEMQNVDHPQELYLSRKKNGETIKDARGKSVVFNGKFFI